MLPALIPLCILAIIICAAAEPFRRATSLQRLSNDLAAARRPHSEWRREKPPTVPHSSPVGDVKLLDIVLAASIDGHFHALNRTTGELIWSMADDLEYLQSSSDPNTENAPPISSQSPLYNLVRSDHRALGAVDDDDEMYIVEPQSGDVFVMQPFAPADSPIERLGYSVPQLVELSPFVPPGDEDRIFIGEKTTSLISLDLLTGRILGVYGERCTWDERTEDGPVDVNAMLDDLDGTQEFEKQRPVEVVIGRTDYRVSVRVKGRGVVQTLSFTRYGPNNVHRAIQAAWTRSPDGTYFQPSPEGKLFSFANGGILRFVRTYPLVVAVFDAVYLPTKRDPILLLQPTPKLSDMSSASTDVDVPKLTYVGRIDDSLFALGHTHYPLVIFSSTNKRLPRIDDGRSTGVPAGSERCYDLDCLTGTRKSQDAMRSGLNRLIEDSHVLAIEGSAGVEPGEVTIPERVISHVPEPKRHTPAQPSPTRTTNSTAPARPQVESTSPEATPSHRTVLRTIASEWIAAWASMGGVVLSTVMFGLGLGVRRGKVSAVWKVIATPMSKVTEEVEVKIDGKSVDDLDDDVPPPVPPKPYSVSRMQNPYLISSGSSGTTPDVPPKDAKKLKDEVVAEVDAPKESPKKPSRRRRPKLSDAASVPNVPTLNPVGQLGASQSLSSVDDKTISNIASVALVEEPLTETALDTEQEAGEGKKRTRRGRRGKGRGKGSNGGVTDGVLSEDTEGQSQMRTLTVPKSSLAVSEEVLGYGSHGTVVYKGRFQGRQVAVKRLLHDFVTLASREVALLQESDDHPNVIRYYYEEHRENFLYIALELCPCSLSDLVERPQQFPDVVGSFDPKRALSQVTAGLKHLHALKIVHRDIKPQNILVSARGAMLISDFGLCRKLDVDQTSFMPTAYGGAAAGTAGWRAPEILRGEVNVDMAALDVSNGGTGTGSAASGTRLTRSVDVFALGCLFFYVLSGGDHAYGARFERDVNILRDDKQLGWLERLGEEGMEAIDLIEQMLSPNPKKRPDTSATLMHPFFWNPGRRLAFLQDASDRFEIMERDPREPGLVALETGALEIVGTDWQKKLDKMFIETLGKFRKYDVKSVQDLLRALRNKKNHYQDLPDNVKRHLGPLPEGFLGYFTRRFPKLFLHVYRVVADSQLKVDPMFRSYFVLEE